MGFDYSRLTYKDSGVSIDLSDAVKKEIKRRLETLGMESRGLFGGFIDISRFKEANGVFLDMTLATIGTEATYKDAGRAIIERATTWNGDKNIPVGSVDYVASGDMDMFIADFVEGVAIGSKNRGFPLVGGESAQMPGTYLTGEFDAFAHVLSMSDAKGLDISSIIRNMDEPQIVVTTDGTGTKTKIIRTPADIINHGLNDLTVQGARPLGFGIYVAGNVGGKRLKEVLIAAESIAKFNELKEFTSRAYSKPDVYLEGEMDIAGTLVGIVDKKDSITGERVEPGDVIIGIAVDGLMTNGYSLARKFADAYCKEKNIKMYTRLDELNGESLNEALSKPHRRMDDILFGNKHAAGILSEFTGDIHALAHITGGGLEGNITRTIPEGYKAAIAKNVLPIPPIMRLMLDLGVDEADMRRTFNLGVGYTIVASMGVAKKMIYHINEYFRDTIPDYDRKAAEIGGIERVADDGKRFEYR